MTKFVCVFFPKSQTLFPLSPPFVPPLSLSAATGLICAFYSLGRSILATAVLWGLGFAAFSSLREKVGFNSQDGWLRILPHVILILSQRDSAGNTVRYGCSDLDTDPNDPDGQCEIQDRVALSFFCGAVMAVSYCLSRSTSNHQYIW